MDKRNKPNLEEQIIEDIEISPEVRDAVIAAVTAGLNVLGVILASEDGEKFIESIRKSKQGSTDNDQSQQ
jgi:hypothetical protein